MGVKISKVREKNKGTVITVRDCEKGFEGDYVCLTQGCGALMSFVPAYEQRRHEKVIQVPSFFKLRANERHRYGVCPFNTKGTIEVIARESDSNIVKALENGKHQLSLQILHKPFTESVRNSSNLNPSADLIGKPKKTKTYASKGTAPSYIKALNQILILRAKLEDNKELASLLTLTYRSKKIKWNNFYFEVDDYFRAFEIAKKMEKPYPMCFHGVVSKVNPPTAKFNRSTIKAYGPYIEMDGVETKAPSLEFPVRDDKLDLTLFEPGTDFLVYGSPSVEESKNIWIPPSQRDEKKPQGLRFLGIKVWINHSAQIIALSEND